MTLPAIEAILLKTERAEKHIADLESVVSAFLKTGPYEEVIEECGDGRSVYRARVIAQPEPRWGLILGDAVHNLRSSLDHLAVALVKAHGVVAPSDETAFPFAKAAKDFEDQLKRRVAGASQAAMDKIRTLKPYPDGNDALWGLHRLDIVDKHHLLIPVGSAARIERIISLAVGDFEPEFLTSTKPGWVYPIEDGTVLREHTLDPGRGKVFVRVEFIYDVAFAKGEVFEGESMVKTLKDLAKLVNEIIRDFQPLV
jgi:hypothetical protein